MSHQSRSRSRRTTSSGRYSHGSSRSDSSANAYAPSTHVPTNHRVGEWTARAQPVPSSHRSHSTSHVTQVSHTSKSGSHDIRVNVEVVTTSGPTNARAQNWESQGLGYAQSPRNSVYYTQVSTSSSAAPAQYFLDAMGNYINIATCPPDVLRRLKREKLRVEGAVEHEQQHHRGPTESRRTRDHVQRIHNHNGSSSSRSVSVGSSALAPVEEAPMRFSTRVRSWKETYPEGY